MQTEGWPKKTEQDDQEEPEKDQEEQEKDLEKAKAVLLTWVKDLRAQPEVLGEPDHNLDHAILSHRPARKLS